MGVRGVSWVLAVRGTPSALSSPASVVLCESPYVQSQHVSNVNTSLIFCVLLDLCLRTVTAREQRQHVSCFFWRFTRSLPTYSHSTWATSTRLLFLCVFYLISTYVQSQHVSNVNTSLVCLFFAFYSISAYVQLQHVWLFFVFYLISPYVQSQHVSNVNTCDSLTIWSLFFYPLPFASWLPGGWTAVLPSTKKVRPDRFFLYGFFPPCESP